MEPQIAMLLQSEFDPTLIASSLRSQLLADWPDLDAEQLTFDDSDADDSGEGDPVVLSYGDALIALMPIDAVAGDDTAELAAHSRLWPSERTLEYTAHTIVTVMHPGDDDDGENGDALADCVLLTKVVASSVVLARTVEAVYWGAASHVVVPELLVDLAKEILPDPIPLLWVAINVGATPTGEMAGFTRGLQALGLMDIEIPQTSEDAPAVFDRLTNLVGYMIDNGPVIGDGDTVGHNAEEKIEVVHADSAFDDGRRVLQLRYSAAQKAKARWWNRR
jgi:hypothetical protein